MLLWLCHATTKNQQNFSQDPINNSSQTNTPTCIDFGTNLAPFGEGVGSQDGAKLAPNRSKIDLQIYQQFITFRVALGTNFDRFGAPTWPRKGLTFVLQIRAFEVLGANLGPRWPHDPPKTLQDPERTIQEACQDNFEAPSSWIWGAPTGWIWSRFGRMFVPTWSDI